MPADPETMSAIHALADGLRALIDKRLSEHKAQADSARQRIYERIDSHAVESRTQLAASTSELRGAITTLGTQVTDLSARFGAHEKMDEREFERVDAELEDQAKRKHGYLQALLAAVFGGIAGWLSRAVGGQS